MALRTDSRGRLGVFGFFNFTTDLDPTEGMAVRIPRREDYNDVYVSLVDPSGVMRELYAFGEEGGEGTNDGVFDREDNLIYAGGFARRFAREYRVDFDPTEGVDFRSTHDFEGGYKGDAFVTKIMANGRYGWTRTVGGTGGDAGFGAAVDSRGDVYITGFFRACSKRVLHRRGAGRYAWKASPGGAGRP